ETININTVKASDEDENAPYSYQQEESTQKQEFKYKEVIHFKTPNLKCKYYGKSKIYKCIDQATLLANIDKFYDKLLGKGNIKTKLLTDESKVLTEKQKEAIAAVINDAVSGVENGFKTAIVPAGLK